MKKAIISFVSSFIFLAVLNSCSNNSGNNATATKGESKSDTNSKTPSVSKGNFNEGTDYLIYDRVRMMDKTGFEVPIEAYSLLLPKGWTSEGDIIWNNPGQSCNGTFKWFKAKSADGKYSFEILPDLLYSWSSNQQMMQFNQNNSNPTPGFVSLRADELW